MRTLTDIPSRVGFTIFLAGALALVPAAAGAVSSTLALRDGAAVEPPAIEVLDSDEHGTRLAIDLPALAVEAYDVDGTTFQSLTMAGGELAGQPGEPAVPAFTRFVAIPADAGVDLRVISVEEETLPGMRLLPMQADEGGAFAIDRALYARDEFLGGDPVTVGAPVILRDLRVVPLTFRPVRFNPLRGEVRVVRRIEVAVEHAGRDLRNAKVRPSTTPSPLMEGFYSSAVVNHAAAGQRGGETRSHRGTWLLICRDDPQVISRLQPLIAWRQRMGFNVVQATTTQTGLTSASIQTWIRQAYTQWDDPPEYIVIVGDVGGSFGVPTFYETWTSHHGEGDHPYVQLDGTDLVPDAFTGRLSAEDYTTLERIVNKIVGYESQPSMSSTTWFARAVLTGDPIDSGPTCVHIQQWLKERLRDVGYAQIDTIFSTPFASQTLTKLNQGQTFYGYRGIYGMSGVGAGDIMNLQNGAKLTFAINLTCDTGSWAQGLSRSEAWLRAGVGATTVTGGIGSIGTATTGTHTRYNNCFYSGAAYGLFWDDHHCIGLAHARGKLEMILNYNDPEPTEAGRYCYWNTLIGDPATVIWTATPQSLTVDYPAVLPVGANVVTVSVRGSGGAPVPGAWVHLYREGLLSQGAATDETGLVNLPIDASSAGTVLVTVTGVNLYPHQGSFTIQPASAYVGLHEYAIDDDAIPPSHGNDNGRLNPGEEVALAISLRNFGPQSAPNVTLTARCDDPNIGWAGPATISFGTIGGYQILQAASPLLLRLYGGCPAGHILRIDLAIVSGSDQWQSQLVIPVEGQELIYRAHTLSGVGTQLDPGEAGTLVVELENVGQLAASGPIQAMLASDSYAISVTDPAGSYGTIAAGGTGTNSANPFGIRAPSDCIPGQLAGLRIILVDATGVRQTAPLAIRVGTADSHDPTGPDAYGYYAYDHTDTDYSAAPSYNWINIDPSTGGLGTSVGLTDYGDGQDDSRTLDLPFTFRYYGQDYDRVTICSNGWLSMGHTYEVTYANYMMPCAFAPPNLIAPFWDDLYQSGSGLVYHWYDEANHRYVVAWDRVRMRINWQTHTESCQAILYDPAYYPTNTGDGEILFQYEVVNNADSEGMYATSGIQNGDHTTGITFNYFNRRPATAANLAAGLAVKFTTQAPGFASAGGGPGAEPRLLLHAGPNPWTAGTTMRFDLAREADVLLRVLDLNGRVVRVLRQGPAPAGPQAVTWTGADERGAPLPGGVYLLQLEAAGETSARRTVLVR